MRLARDAASLAGNAARCANRLSATRRTLPMARPSSLRLTRRVSPAWATLTVVYLAFTATFASYSVNNDGRVYLDFMRRLTGEPGPSAPTHQFGSAIFTLPFFLVA